jgi:Flp pilus assembly CpaF family ATPase
MAPEATRSTASTAQIDQPQCCGAPSTADSGCVLSVATSPDRIVVGEVRDEAALDLLDAWQTGHPGGCATVHANDPLSALNRLDRLAQRAGVGPQPDLVADAIQLIVMIAGGARGRRVTDIVEVAGRAAGAYRLDPLPAF